MGLVGRGLTLWTISGQSMTSRSATTVKCRRLDARHLLVFAMSWWALVFCCSSIADASRSHIAIAEGRTKVC